jgi:hypothetical protein
MSLAAGRMPWTRTISILCVAIFLLGGAAVAQQKATGRVINRNGEPQRNFKVDFYWNPNEAPKYTALTDESGNFFVYPQRENYTVVVRGGPWEYRIKVTVDDNGLHPSTLVVNW